jgi:hypothetical protein
MGILVASGYTTVIMYPIRTRTTVLAMATDAPEELAPGDQLRWYIKKFETPYGQSTVPFANTVRKFLTPAGRLRAKQVATNLKTLSARRTARRLAMSKTVQLHLGCGRNYLDGWINIDLVGVKTDLDWDIRRPLPFKDGTVDAMFLEHVFEHMNYGSVFGVLEHLRSALRSGGVLRVGVPDAGMYARMYVEEPERLRTWRWGRATSLLALREVFQEHGHVTAWDGPTMQFVLEQAGFPNAQVSMPGRSELLDGSPDSPERWDETVYVEVQRP